MHRPVSLYGSREGRATNNPAGPLLSDCGNINVNNDGGSGNTTSPPIDMTLGALTMRSLPYPQPWSRTNASPGEVPPNFNWLSESCGGKAAIGVIGGECYQFTRCKIIFFAYIRHELQNCTSLHFLILYLC